MKRGLLLMAMFTAYWPGILVLMNLLIRKGQKNVPANWPMNY
jgi:hypothetical protein